MFFNVSNNVGGFADLLISVNYWFCDYYYYMIIITTMFLFSYPYAPWRAHKSTLSDKWWVSFYLYLHFPRWKPFKSIKCTFFLLVIEHNKLFFFTALPSPPPPTPTPPDAFNCWNLKQLYWIQSSDPSW